MSSNSDTDLNLDLHFLPEWAKKSSDAKDYSKYTGNEGGGRSDSRGRGRPPGGGGSRPPRQGGRPQSDRRPPSGGGGRSGGGSDRGGAGRGGQDSRRGPQDRDARRGGNRFRPEPPRLPDVKVSFIAEDRGVDSLAKQIKMTGRAFPLFEIGQMVLQKPERYSVVFSEVKNADGKVAQPLFVCALDDTIWLSEESAEKYILDKHLDTFYKAEKTPTDPPKGTYTFVAVCGMTGRILGPPNYHDYQTQLAKLHKERFSNMAFDVFKSRVKIVRDEETVNKWVEGQSFKTEYDCLNLPEPKRLGSWEEVLAHFQEVHRDNVIRRVESHTLGAAVVRNSPSTVIQQLVRRYLEEQQRFPLKLVHVLSQQFASRGLQFFKVNKSVTFVSVARPHFLDLESSPISDSLRKIVEYINANSGCNRKQLIEALAPTPEPAAAAPSVIPNEVPAPAASGEAADGETTGTKAAVPAPANEPTREQQLVITDLHWLIHQGHVIEFSSGKIETAKRPAPKKVTTPSEKKPIAPKVESEKPPEVVAKATPQAEVAPAADSASEASSEVKPLEEQDEKAPEVAAEPVAEAPAVPEEIEAASAASPEVAPDGTKKDETS